MDDLILALVIIVWAALIALLLRHHAANFWLTKAIERCWGWWVRQVATLYDVTLGKLEPRWRVEVQLEGQWFVKTFWTRLGAWHFQRMVRASFNSYAIFTYKEGHSAKQDH